MPGLIIKDEVYAIIGAAMEAYNQLGEGFLESVYQEALEIEAHERRIPFVPRHIINVPHQGRTLNKHYIADLFCFEKIIVELKALDHITTREEFQLINYLKAVNLQVGLMINFGSRNNLEWKRMVFTGQKSHQPEYSTRFSKFNPRDV